MSIGRWYLLAAIIGVGAPAIAAQFVDSADEPTPMSVYRLPTSLEIRTNCAERVTEGVAELVDGAVLVDLGGDDPECAEVVLLGLDEPGPVDVVVILDDSTTFRCPSAPEPIPPASQGPFGSRGVVCVPLVHDVLGEG